LSGKKFPVKSTIYILAAGGLENPRLLLESRNIQTNGVGNQNDLVGRFFMEHPFGFSGAVHAFPADFPQDYLRLNYESFQRNLGAARAIGLPDSLMRSEQLLNASAFFVRRPIYKTDDRFYSKRARGFLNLIEVLRRRRPPSLNLLKDLGETIFHGGTVLILLTKAARALLGAGGQYAIHIQAETVPNPESRVTLSSQKDALGMHQISLQWKLSSQDLESYQRFEDHVHLGLQKLGFRTTRYRHDLDDEGWPVFTAAGKHHMGTTRMSQNAREGVVDENCRVHGISNLYIAGSSVFPTSGMVNPTLTIVALAVRLADRVKQILA
jgi:choline dehydrogenase-like flavoprotein